MSEILTLGSKKVKLDMHWYNSCHKKYVSYNSLLSFGNSSDSVLSFKSFSALTFD